MKRLVLMMIPALILVMGAGCNKGMSNKEIGKDEFCSYVNTESIGKTIPIVNDYLEGLSDNLNDEEKLQALTEWFKSCPCIMDATIICMSCIYTLPAQSEVSILFKENDKAEKVVFDIIMSEPLKARICSTTADEKSDND